MAESDKTKDALYWVIRLHCYLFIVSLILEVVGLFGLSSHYKALITAGIIHKWYALSISASKKMALSGKMYAIISITVWNNW